MLWYHKPTERIMLKDEEVPFKDYEKPRPRKKASLWMKVLFVAVTILVLCIDSFAIGYISGKASMKNRLIAAPSKNRKKLLLISIDGFRFDYIMRGKTPNLVELARNGYMSRLVPQFPSYTFPNHFSIVTGLYPESHGIVSNAFYDPSSQKFFYFTNSSSTMQSTFWNADPIWNTNQAQGGESAVLHYPGSDVEIKGRRPSHYAPFTDQISSKERVNIMEGWLEDNPFVNLAILYFDEVDHAGHLYGPDSKEVNKALKSVDNAIGDFVATLKRKNVYDDYNIVLVSDHGMTKAVDEKRIVLDKVIPNLDRMLEWSDFGPVTSMIPKPEYRYRLGVELRRAIRKHKLPVRLLTKNNMPAAYHYTRNERIPPFVLEAKKGWTIDLSSMEWRPRGLHGYGESVRDMDGIFIANGPAFRKNPQPSYPFHSNLDVYPLMCQLLGIEPKPNNGTFELGMHSMFSPRQLF